MKQERPKWLENVVDFLTDNPVSLITLLFSGVIGLLQGTSIINLSTPALIGLVIVVLDLLVISSITERYKKLNSIEKSASQAVTFLESRFTERPSAIAFFQKPPDLDNYIQSSTQIDMCGVTLTSTLNKQFGNLRGRLQAGANIRILISDPTSLALRMSAERSINPTDIEYHRIRIDSSFREITYLFKSWEEFKVLGTTNKTGTLEVRLISYAPSFGLYSFNRGQPNGIAFSEIYPHKYGYETPPNFELTPHRDGQWYKYFTSQFDQMWDAAKPWAPKVTVEQLSQGNGHLSPEVLYGNLSASNFFLPNKGISNDTFRSANTIYISGMTLNRTSREYMHILEERLTAGANVRIMILDTNKPLMQELVRRSAGKTTPEYWKNKIQTVETLLRVIAKNPNQNGKLELGHLPYIPSFGMVIIDPKESSGVCVTELYHHESSEQNPTFTVNPRDDGKWFSFFVNQYEIMWNSCRTENLAEKE